MQKLKYNTLAEPLQYEIPKIKGSRFIAKLIPVHTREEIDYQLLQLQKKYHDATHLCYAWRFGVQAHQDLFGNRGVNSQQERANDDGEPTNTAGKPILSVLSGNQIFDVLGVVIRYFGGTLLGVGGLIQAYTQATQAGLAHGTQLQREITKNLIVSYSYDQLSLVQYLFSKYEPQILAEEYGEKIQQEIAVNIVFFEIMKAEVLEKQIKILDN